ncbi:glycosyltransferase [Mesorhizobium sp. CC13]|uniref:glycosyltransferase n=1 Tax=Mesorhizobium sp. CC13 TaxID=3029194 RepID=UPI0032650D4E
MTSDLIGRGLQSRRPARADRTVSTPRVLIDNSLSIVNRTGAYHIAKDLCREFVPDVADVRYWRLGRHGPEGLFRKLSARLMMAEIGFAGNSERLLIRDDVGRGGFRLFLDPLYVLRSALAPDDIVLCHDTGPLTHPALYHPGTVQSYRHAYGKIARIGPGVVFVSNWSRDSFVSLYGSDFRFLTTIPLYVRSELFEGPAKPVDGLEPPFILTVGAFETRKNQTTALRAYRDGGFHRRGIRYVLCGSRGAGHEEIVELARTVPGVRILDYVPDAELRWLYGNAEAFLLPSLLEGFGMPALEAAYMGLLPIVSAGSALVEAVDGVCIEIPPVDPAAIANAIDAALARDPAEKAATANRLRTMAAAFTKARFLSRWRDLLMSNGMGDAAGKTGNRTPASA